MVISKILKWINHNRFIVIGPVVGLVIWIFAIGCMPTTLSPITLGLLVNSDELEIEFMTWQKEVELTTAKFEAAGQDIEKQKADQLAIQEFIVTMASGGIADVPGLIQLLIGGGALGALADNIRKRSYISGLKQRAKEQ